MISLPLTVVTADTHLYPNIKLESSVNHKDKLHKTASFNLEIKDLQPELANSTLNRIFIYVAETVAQDLNPTVTVSTIASSGGSSTSSVTSASVNTTADNAATTSNTNTETGTSFLEPDIKIDITMSFVVSFRLAIINISVKNLQVALITTTLTRILNYLTTALTTDLNGAVIPGSTTRT